MKNHKYQDEKYIHLCESARIDERNSDTYLVWSVCGIDVPANKSFVSDECITCPDCCNRQQDELAEGLFFGPKL